MAIRGEQSIRQGAGTSTPAATTRYQLPQIILEVNMICGRRGQERGSTIIGTAWALTSQWRYSASFPMKYPRTSFVSLWLTLCFPCLSSVLLGDSYPTLILAGLSNIERHPAATASTAGSLYLNDSQDVLFTLRSTTFTAWTSSSQKSCERTRRELDSHMSPDSFTILTKS